MIDVTFYGVRGSCPCPSSENHRYGGNTACVALNVHGEPPIVFDLGTGLQYFGRTQPLDGSFVATALVTHIHWDHIQGLPFFPPANREGARFDIYGPPQDGETLEEAFSGLMRPPYFPVQYQDLRGDIIFHDVWDDTFPIGGAKVKVRPVPHVGDTVGYRVEWEGMVVAYISDHQAPADLITVADSVLELAEGADLLIHDAQYTPEEFVEKSTWGHCTMDYAVRVAEEAGAKKLALFHHDPAHTDDDLDCLFAHVQHRATGGPLGPHGIVAAREGLSIRLS